MRTTPLQKTKARRKLTRAEEAKRYRARKAEKEWLARKHNLKPSQVLEAMLSVDNRKGAVEHYGMGAQLSSKAYKSLDSYHCISQYLIHLVFNLNLTKLHLIGINLPHDQTDRTRREDILNQLHNIANNIPNHKICMIMGDLNAQFLNMDEETDSYWRQKEIYPQGEPRLKQLENKASNSNYDMIKEFCIANDFLQLVVNFNTHLNINIHGLLRKAIHTIPLRLILRLIDNWTMS